MIEPDISELINFDFSDINVTYPPVSDVIYEMHTIFLLLNMPQWEKILIQHGVVYADAVVELPQDFFRDVIGMPAGVIGTFRRYARGVICCAQKGKGKATIVDDNEGAENM